ncbi:juvenile hormone esterase-like isoform X2 [Halyomorpha halys]|nr:esterase FE4-like isoform X3 [Halyomorpha halys]XP_014271728.1 esterase FE4-like isoform X3 [Halyomorpha halys]
MQRTVLLPFLLVWTVSAYDDPIVETFSGWVRGFTSISRSGRQYSAFTGIPFAKAPVGELRFQPPQEVEKWRGIKNATEDGPFCIQCNMSELDLEVIGEEDCLHLSVYTHNTRGYAPVMVHMHGGGFFSGDKSTTNPQYLMDEDVVIVDINYRVGIMGFLSFENTILPGNQGLKDQNMALQWVIKNIARFGGNPRRITLVGESAGAGSVLHHMVSPMSRGLFQGAIVESGSIYSMVNLLPPGVPKARTKKLINLISCPHGYNRNTLNCLQQKDAKDLVGHLRYFREWQVDPLLLFQPVLEPKIPGALVTGPIRSWQPSPIPMLIGTTSAEGLQRTKYFLEYDMDFKWYNDNFEKVAPLSLRYLESASNPKMVTDAVKQFYFKNKEITKADWVNITNAYTDAYFTAGIFDAANKHTGDVYFYYFDYVGEYTKGPKDRNYTFGAAHVDEIIYLWYIKKYSPLKGKDIELSKKIVKIWTDFVKFGNVNSPEKNERWDKWTREVHNYLHISENGLKAKKGLHEDRYKFWKSINYRDKFDCV